MRNVSDTLMKKACYGNIDAQYMLALRFCVKNDARQAEHWFSLAASKGHGKATTTLDEFRKLGLFASAESSAPITLQQ